MNTPNRGIPYVPEGTLDPAAGLNQSLDVIDAIVVPKVVRMDLTAPPVGPVDGALYVVASPATGDWAGLEDYVVRYREEGDFWQEYPPAQVYLLLNSDDLGLYKWDDGMSPGAWTLAAGIGGITVENEDSPQTVVNTTTTLVMGNGLELTQLAPGVAHIEATGGGGIAVQDLESPPNEVDPATRLTFGDGFLVTDQGAGEALVEFPGGGGGGGDESGHPLFDVPPSSPDAMDDEFNDNNFDTTKWTWLNQGTATISEAAADYGHATLTDPSGAGANLRALEQTLPATPWRFRAKVALFTNRTNVGTAGLYIRSSVSSRIYTFNPIYESGEKIYVQRYTNASTFSATQTTLTLGQVVTPYIYLDIENDGTTLFFRYSFSGHPKTFNLLYSEAQTTWFTGGNLPNRIGFFANSHNSAPVGLVLDWFRRIV